MRSASAVVMTLLAVGIVVLGVLYYQETRNDITIRVDPPKIEVK